MIRIDKNNKLNLSALHENQQEFIKSKKLHTAIVGGYQSGKSLAGTTKVLTKLLQHPGVPCAYYLPTYGLITDMLVPKFKSLFETVGIPYDYNQKYSRFTTKYGEVWMRSMHDPDKIISYSVGYSIADEIDVMATAKAKIAVGRIVARNSYKTSGTNSIDFVSTPEGFGFMYNMFWKDKDNPNKQLLKLSTMDNIDNLGTGYVDALKEVYTEEQLKAYLNGVFVNINSGTVYKHFDRHNNRSNRRVQKTDVLHIGMDFNITNMNAVLHVIDGIPIAVDEITGAYDTNDLCQKIQDKYPKHSIVIYPDASGSNRSTSGKTDIDIIKSYRFIVRKLSQNPLVKDRVNTMNVSFLDNQGNRNYLVNTDQCPVYTEALELQAYKKGSPDKDGGFDHITEAGGYFIWGNKKKKTARIYAA